MNACNLNTIIFNLQLNMIIVYVSIDLLTNGIELQFTPAHASNRFETPFTHEFQRMCVFFPSWFLPAKKRFNLFWAMFAHSTWDYPSGLKIVNYSTFGKATREPLFENYLFPIFSEILIWNWRLNNWTNRWLMELNIEFCIYRLCLWLNDG